MGAPVAVENPAQAPPVIENLLQARYFLPNIDVPPFPAEVPICTDGPSVPRGTPIKKESKETKKVPINVISHLNFISPLRIAIDVGIPPPFMLGIFYITKRTKKKCQAEPLIKSAKNTNVREGNHILFPNKILLFLRRFYKSK